MVKYAALKGLYETEKTIGCGGFAKVKLATHLATGEKVAIKIMEKAQLADDLPRVKLELKALKTLSHQHICKLYQVIETETHYFIVVEYCSGGELFDHIVEKSRLTETESRMFFRQIVSAVAYLHSLGYAHRDLKPENVLLDKNQNLKLIDFGLCARPEGGISSPLYTSCGSPTYAAPELILGKQYLGPEVDVWAMGVLLYALLVGSLPFDDTNIDSLYKKILNGRYLEPSFLSLESKRLIRSMLQVDPKKRITVNQLLSHSWLTLGILDSVDYKSENWKTYDENCVKTMSKTYNLNCVELWRYLRKWKYDYHTATYFLLLARKKRGDILRLRNVSVQAQLRARLGCLQPLNVIQLNGRPAHPLTPTPIAPVSPLTPSAPVTPITLSVPVTPTAHPLTPNLETDKKMEQFVEPPKPRKALKRFRSPTLDDERSPVPLKKATPGKSTPSKTPDRKCGSNSETPGSARKMLGSIERSFNKVRHVLTPKKPSDSTALQPVLLNCKNLCNVSTTQCNDPEFVINELRKGLEKKSIHCDRKGFTLRGKLEPNVLHRFGGCSFELEVCYLPALHSLPQNDSSCTKSILKNGPLNNANASTPTKKEEQPNLVGIRRKRLKGDSWCYKKVCEQVLALTATDFRIAESTV